MSPLQTILDSFRQAAVTEREKGTYFEELILAYLRNEATYKDLYSDVWTYSDWAAQQQLDKRDTGIDLVAKTRGTNEYHAIQCKFYAEDYKVQRRDIDSFFTASGQRPFTHRIIISTTNNWSEHAEDALRDQQPPVSKIDLYDLENSQIDWTQYQVGQAPVLKPLKTLHPHQINALEAVQRGLATADRGKLIMACGTGKTFTSLKIAEKLAGAGGRVLFLVPSLSLLSQTLTEWTQESEVPLHSFAVCSDSDVGKKRRADDDMVQTFTHELRYPATTNAKRLAEEMTKRYDSAHMSVVFSTYHSIATISEAQHEFDLAEFDLVICDEAHRTTGATFLIPDYQRPYAWNEEQCLTLWDDIFEFAFPNNNTDDFDNESEYFLGAIVTYKNDKVSEVIDGQQRLTTLMLLLRAFYDKFERMKDQNAQTLRARIEKCLWKMDEFGNLDKESLKISSEVATDNDKEEFVEILRTGVVKGRDKSRYAENFVFFQRAIENFINEYPSYIASLAARILNNCILLPIEAESQDSALRIFSTLNDRGLPLSDADIFKAQFYKYYSSLEKKDWFIDCWKELEEITDRIFHPSSGTPMDELFTRYMYYLRAKEGVKTSSTEALRKFYERGKYHYLHCSETIENLRKVAYFWERVYQQDTSFFSEKILKKLFVLTYAPNGMWQHMVTVYFLINKDDEDKLSDINFGLFLDKITAFILAHAIINPGVNALRTPAYDEMVNIVKGNKVTFSKYRFDEIKARPLFDNHIFTNQKAMTRSLLTWYAFTFEDQELLKMNETFQIEHIYAKKRQEIEKGLARHQNIELLGNKILLERSINIRASDYRFEDKKKIYAGKQGRGASTKVSQIAETKYLCEATSFDETDILERNRKILDRFFDFLKEEDLLIEG